MSKRKDSRYSSGRSPHWIKSKNPNAPAVKREAEEDWGQQLREPTLSYAGPVWQFIFPGNQSVQQSVYVVVVDHARLKRCMANSHVSGQLPYCSLSRSVLKIALERDPRISFSNFPSSPIPCEGSASGRLWGLFLNGKRTTEAPLTPESTELVAGVIGAG